jgi:hypothetical protein
MKIKSITLKGKEAYFELGAGVPAVTNIKYLEASIDYGQFGHEPIYVVRFTDPASRVIIPARNVCMFELDTKKDDVAAKAIEKLGETA